MLLCILHKLVIGFAVVGVINGVFIQAGRQSAKGKQVQLTRAGQKRLVFEHVEEHHVWPNPSIDCMVLIRYCFPRFQRAFVGRLDSWPWHKVLTGD